MPAKNAIKPYVADSYYHVYNRGVNKQVIFPTVTEYNLFLSLIDRYMSKVPHTRDDGSAYPSFHGRIEISAYCLMNNHYHLLVKTKEKPRDLAEFMRCLITSYTIHLNNKYDRVGHLFQGRYKAVLQTSQSQFLHTSRYIHQNPREISDISSYKYSSYQYYIRKNAKPPAWLMSQNILKYYRQPGTKLISAYKSFVADYMQF